MTITRRAPGGLTSSPDTGTGPVIDASVARATVRPARLDRPLRQGALDPGYTDPHLEELVQSATREARESAQAQGYAAGWAQGRQAAAAAAAQEAVAAQAQLAEYRAAAALQIDQLMAGLAQATADMSQRTQPEWQELADILCDGAFQLACGILSRELGSVDDAMVANIRAALQLLADPAEAVVHLHPQDAAILAQPPAGVRIVPDAAVPAGGVVALTATQRLRLDLPEALAVAQRVLNP
jgi:flagellar assembly protein FliH